MANPSLRVLTALHDIPAIQGVFDTCKLETVKSRIQSSIRGSIIYFRSSPSLRTNRGFRNDSHLLPQPSLKACTSHLRAIGEDLSREIEQHFPGGEADFYIANLATQRNAFILSLDSDFFITSYGSKGYIPLDSLHFVRQEKAIASLDSKQDAGEGDWGEVRSTRRRQRNTAAGDGAAAGGSEAYASVAQANQIHCKVYTADALAKCLSLPSVAYLPLCAILSGNDYYTPPIWKSSNSPPGSSHSNSTNGSSTARRFELVASSILRQLRKMRRPLDREGLPEFVRRVIDDIRDFAISEGQISDIAKAALATLPEYCVSSINATWSHSSSTSRSGAETPVSISSFGIQTESDSTVNPLHALLLPSTSAYSSAASSEQADNTQIKLRIYNAFENGHFRNVLLQIVVFGTFTPSAVLEDPDKTSNVISLGRPLRAWIYAILHASVGIGRQSSTTYNNANGSDVPEETDSESHDEADGTSSAEGGDGHEPTATISVVEHVRRNTALSDEAIIVPSWTSMDPLKPSNDTPPLARSTLDRFYILLHATASFTDRLCATSGPHLAILGVLLSLRHIAFIFEGTGQAWSDQERKAALLTSLVVLKAYQGGSEAGMMLERYVDPILPVSNDNLQRAAQLTNTLSSVSYLVETLLLTPLLSIPAETLYQGSLFIELLNKFHGDDCAEESSKLLEQTGLDPEETASLLDMMEEGLPQSQLSEKVRTKNEKKQRKAGKNTRPLNVPENVIAHDGSGRKGSVPVNKFALLG